MNGAFALSSHKIYETIMKKFCILSLLAVSAMMFFVACSGKKYENGPSDVALALYTGLTSGDVAAVTENIYFQDSHLRKPSYNHL